MTTSERKMLQTNRLDRIASNDKDIEIMVIACLLKSKEARDMISRIEEDDFYYLEHKKYFVMLNEYIKNNKDFDIYAVPNRTTALTSFYSRPDVLVSNFHLYLRRLKEISNIRKIEYMAHDISTNCQEGKNSIEIREKFLDSLSSIKPHDLKDIVNVGEAINDFDSILDYDFSKNVSTGFNALDRMIGGLQPSGLYAIAGVPAAGKTTFILNMIHNVLKDNKKVLFASFEMSYREVINRFVSMITGLSTVAMRGANRRTYTLEDKTLKTIAAAKEKIKKYDLNFIGKGGLSVSDIADRMKYLGGVQVLFVDYLQLIKSAGKTRYEQVTQISRDLKMLAMQFDIPVVVVASINRANMARPDKRPQLSDFRDSGNIEYDLDGAFLLYRPAQFKADANETEAELDIAKNRFGKSNVVMTMEWHPEIASFTNMEKRGF
jgi:replicative DNA helicase